MTVGGKGELLNLLDDGLGDVVWFKPKGRWSIKFAFGRLAVFFIKVPGAANRLFAFHQNVKATATFSVKVFHYKAFAVFCPLIKVVGLPQKAIAGDEGDLTRQIERSHQISKGAIARFHHPHFGNLILLHPFTKRNFKVLS